jgi:hypothetical protein
MYLLGVEPRLLDDLPLLPWSEKEMRRSPLPAVFIRRSDPVWVLTDDENHTYAMIGIITPTLASTPELWVLLCEGFKKHLRAGLAAFRENLPDLLDRFPHVMVRVDAEAPCGQKLVESFGFTEYHREFRGDREYIYYEVRK